MTLLHLITMLTATTAVRRVSHKLVSTKTNLIKSSSTSSRLSCDLLETGCDDLDPVSADRYDNGYDNLVTMLAALAAIRRVWHKRVATRTLFFHTSGDGCHGGVVHQICVPLLYVFDQSLPEQLGPK
jgi:hypothetical protein